ncbi:hypothetical protein C2R22_18835 [Salinigranum rubrum]|uniref:Uncharacterized protein n=1 Tax=Salinigranum rubrum TaxID=755307 RepID=A0A2I8VNE4_9EURY|nr:hypothetical protein [Salinigranum rubrum]AUV83446.1 hypothetical protein C2R22_18835 [Salinigranum rubrum]
MERRPFLVLLTTALAGCGATNQSTPEPTAPPTDTPTESPPTATEPTETATDTPTESPTDTPSPEVREAQQRLSAVTSTLDAAVEQYVGDAGETILAADASYLEFDGDEVVAAVEEAERELERAREAVVTEEQEETLASLEEMTRFLRLATETQTSLVDAYYHLTETREALASADDGAAEDAMSEMDAASRIASSPYQTLVEETAVSATSVLSELDTERYRRKLTQFEAEIRAFGDLRAPLDTFATAVGRLGTARALELNGSTDQARQIARDAARELDEVAAAFATFTTDLEEPADSLAEMGESLEGLATEMATETREQFGIDDEETTTATTTTAA